VGLVQKAKALLLWHEFYLNFIDQDASLVKSFNELGSTIKRIEMSEQKKFINQKNNIPYGTSPDGFVPAMAISDFLADKQKILIVGDFTKRDYAVLHALGKDVSVIDIVPIEGVENFYLQSITEKTPFEDKFFDGG